MRNPAGRKLTLRSSTRRFAWLLPAALALAVSAANLIASPPAIAALQPAAPAASAAAAATAAPAAAAAAGAGWVHAYAAFGEPKYGPGFTHFEYADPAAPKGGTLYLKNPDRRTSFDKFNPFTVKGSSPGVVMWFSSAQS